MPRNMKYVRESGFSVVVRSALRAAGADVIQLIDTGIPGSADLLVVWRGHFAFIELKCGAPMPAQQRRFLRRHWELNRNAFVLKLSRSGVVRLWSAVSYDLVRAEPLWFNSAVDGAAILSSIEERQ